jgi:hypothetical protein
VRIYRPPAPRIPWEQQGAATWTPRDVRENPPVQAGRPPRMTYMRWGRSQQTDTGATAPREWYWRCRTPRCRRWSGPYGNPRDAAQDGNEHEYRAHPRGSR